MKALILNNLSYKLVALGVALILWVTMLGRKDATLVRDFQLQVVVAAGTEIVGAVPPYVQVEIMGPRIALKKLSQSAEIYTLDLRSLPLGPNMVRLSPEGVSLPLGARILSIYPAEIRVMLRASSTERRDKIQGKIRNER